MIARVFLGLVAVLFVPYGIYCFFVPGSLTEAAGVVSITATGATELRAMYGGLQTGLGLLAGLAVVRADWVRPALLAVAFAGGGLFCARITGSTLESGWSQYTGIALALEASLLVVSVLLLRRAPAAA
ncbi:MAG TPA: DUF4345 family protein [Myxococcota bacterium]|nr:DUF4345 family protein [Myxococcota bacterium]